MNASQLTIGNEAHFAQFIQYTHIAGEVKSITNSMELNNLLQKVLDVNCPDCIADLHHQGQDYLNNHTSEHDLYTNGVLYLATAYQLSAQLSIKDITFTRIKDILKKAIHTLNTLQESRQQENLLHWFAKWGNPSIFHCLFLEFSELKESAHINALTKIDKESPLHLAIKNNYISIVRILIENGADITVGYYGEESRTVLHIACQKGYVDIAELLLSHKDIYKIINIPQGERLDNGGFFPCHLAAKYGHYSILEKLVFAGATFTQITSGGINQYSILDCLISLCESSDLRKRDDTACFFIKEWTGEIPNADRLFDAAVRAGLPRALKQLKERRKEIPTKPYKCDSTFIEIACHGAFGGKNSQNNENQASFIEVIIFLITIGFDPTDIFNGTYSGTFLVHLACEYGQYELLKYLIERNESQLNIKNSSSDNPLHAAAICRADCSNVIEYLMEKCPALVNQNNIHGKSPLHLAAENGNSASVKLLIKYTNNINEKDSEGNTALHLAAEGKLIPFGFKEVEQYECIIKDPLDSGADKGLKNNENKISRDLVPNKQEFKKISDVISTYQAVEKRSVSTIVAKSISEKPLLFSELLENIFNCVKNNYSKKLLNELENFIAPFCKSIVTNKEKLLLDETFEFLRDDNGSVFLLMGDAGLGKSVFTHFIEKMLVEKYSEFKIIPIRINLERYTNNPNSCVKDTLIQNYKLNDIAIEQLKKYKVLFIFDEYNKLKLDYGRNILIDNELHLWKDCKVIVTSRPERFKRISNRKILFSLDPAAVKSVVEYCLIPFNQSQIECYIDKKCNDPSMKDYLVGWLKKTKFEKKCTPLVLKLFLDVVYDSRHRQLSENDLQRKLKSLQEFTLFKLFTEYWFSCEINYLFKTDTQIDSRAIGGFLNYARDLAIEMVMGDTYEISFQLNQFSPVLYQSKFKKDKIKQVTESIGNNLNKLLVDYFLDTDPIIVMNRTACPLIITVNSEANSCSYRFAHDKFLDFFAADFLYAFLLELKEKYDRNGMDSILADIKDHPLNQILFHEKRRSVTVFLAECIQKNSDLKSFMLDKLLFVSRQRPEFSKTSSNVVTILNYAGVSFTNKDLRDINIQSADLTGAVLDSACLVNSVLDDVNFTGAILRNANLEGASLKNTIFGNKAKVFDKVLDKRIGEIHAIAISPNNQWIAIGWSNGEFVVQNLQDSRKRFTKNLGEKEAVYSIGFSHELEMVSTGHKSEKIRLWNLSSCDLLQEMDTNGYIVVDIKFSVDDKYLAAGCNQGYLMIFLVQENYRCIKSKDIKRLPMFIEHSQEVLENHLKNHPWLGLYHRDWAYKLNKYFGPILDDESTQRRIAFCPDGKFIARNDHLGVFIQSLSSSECKLLDVGSSAEDICYSPSGKLLAAVFLARGQICVWDTKNNYSTKYISFQHTMINDFGFIDELNIFVITGSYLINCNIIDGDQKIIEKYKSSINVAQFNNSLGYFIVGSNDGTLYRTSNYISEHNDEYLTDMHYTAIKDIKYNNLDQIVITSDKRKVCLWDYSTGKFIISYNPSNNSSITSIGIDNFGKYLAIATDAGDLQQLEIWDVENKNCLLKRDFDNVILITNVYLFNTSQNNLLLILLCQSGDIYIFSNILSANSSICEFKRTNESLQSIMFLGNEKIVLCTKNNKEVLLIDCFCPTTISTIKIESDSHVVDIAHSHDGIYLAILFSSKKIVLYKKHNDIFQIKFEFSTDDDIYEATIAFNINSSILSCLIPGWNESTIIILSVSSLTEISRNKFSYAAKAMRWATENSFLIGSESGYLQKWQLQNPMLKLQLVWATNPFLDCENLNANDVEYISDSNLQLLNQLGATKCTKKESMLMQDNNNISQANDTNKAEDDSSRYRLK